MYGDYKTDIILAVVNW